MTDREIEITRLKVVKELYKANNLARTFCFHRYFNSLPQSIRAEFSILIVFSIMKTTALIATLFAEFAINTEASPTNVEKRGLSLPPLIPSIPGVTEPLASNIPPLPILQVPTPPLESPPFPVSNIKPKKIGYFWTGAGDNNHKDFLVVTSLDDVTSPLLTLFVLSLQDDRTHLVPSSILLMFQPVETPHTTLGLLWMARPSWEAVFCRC